jgi:hypothetical protein
MKTRIFSNWNLMRWLRLIIGTAGTVQGLIIGEYALSIFSFLLVYMAIADVGCCGAGGCAVEFRKVEAIQNETKHEEVDHL